MLSKKSMKVATLSAVISAGFALSSCGTVPSDRALSGGLLGAGTGAIIGSVAGSAGKGALIGGLGGMAIGALTSPGALNLGEPIWRHSAGYRHRHYASRTARNDERCTTRISGSERITTCPKSRE
jgi:osmotically inducible lipoprotein OsmB